MICGSRAAAIRDVKRVDFWIKPQQLRCNIGKVRELARNV